ncbi:nucleotide exchange factor GrpE [Bartonella sp. HY329]|uniref:nucleotide exchange factor GrpE n=1 Tax=unclassified Bartonella TaxID=2645622 RepID=UPI0021C88D9C|nr:MULTISPECIES: nucleotide exchange factor GrpE [unclassified Bartonella]UXM95655.1 nucleotide exchange factor GrpE [Bartonella sp. HY329]UXN09980.1 nucleotide exchange factor GrpE [Bartonella sp. HY328]
MSDEKHVDENIENARDLRNPKDRDELRQAADDFLKSRKAEERMEIEDEEGVITARNIDLLQDENASLKDQLLRVAAEMENLRRRTARDVNDAKTYAVANFARDMLAVSDNLGRALTAIPADARENDANLSNLAEGVEMTERLMQTTMERYGITKAGDIGDRFDPNFHQAMFEVPDPSKPANTIAQIIQDGYVIGERVLRPALVGVTTGGPKDVPVSDE